MLRNEIESGLCLRGVWVLRCVLGGGGTTNRVQDGVRRGTTTAEVFEEQLLVMRERLGGDLIGETRECLTVVGEAGLVAFRVGIAERNVIRAGKFGTRTGDSGGPKSDE